MHIKSVGAFSPATQIHTAQNHSITNENIIFILLLNVFKVSIASR